MADQTPYALPPGARQISLPPGAREITEDRQDEQDDRRALAKLWEWLSTPPKSYEPPREGESALSPARTGRRLASAVGDTVRTAPMVLGGPAGAAAKAPGALGAIARAATGLGARSAAGEVGAQAVEKAGGARGEFDPLAVGVAAAAPSVGGAVGRGIAAVPRLFRTANAAWRTAPHTAAAGALKAAAQAQAPRQSADSLYDLARQVGRGEQVPVRRTAAKASSLARELKPALPSSGVADAKRAVKDVGKMIHPPRPPANAQGVRPPRPAPRQAVSLEELMGKDRGLRDMRKIPEAKALGKAINRDVAAAAKAGGQGARTLLQAKQAHQRELAVAQFQKLVDEATKAGRIDMPKLSRDFARHSENFTRWLGPQGKAALDDEIAKHMHLPATTPGRLMSTVWPVLAALGAGGSLANPAMLAAIPAALIPHAVAVGPKPVANVAGAGLGVILRDIMSGRAEEKEAAARRARPEDRIHR